MQTIVCFINNLLDNNTALQYNKKTQGDACYQQAPPRGFNPDGRHSQIRTTKLLGLSQKLSESSAANRRLTFSRSGICC